MSADKNFQSDRPSSAKIDCFLLSEKAEFLLINQPTKTELYEIYFIRNGEGRFKLDSQIIEFQSGSIIFLPPGRFRQWLSYTEGMDAHVLTFQEEFISNYFNDQLFLYRFHYFYNESYPSYLHCNNEERDECRYILLKIKKEVNHKGIDSDHYLRSLLYHILIVLNRKYKRDYHVTVELLYDSQSTNFKKLLEQNIKSLTQVKDFAHAMGISKTQLNQITKKTFGKNAGLIIKERRMAEAKRLILFTNKGIAQIAHELNYSEASNFNRSFKSITGITPAKFRLIYSN